MVRSLSPFGILGQSPAMKQLSDWVHAAAPCWDTILITGERGVGKELLAKAIHCLGPTRNAEPVIVDCASLHPATVEASLFGHERGAFTGAVHRKIGFFEMAHEGTIFLDEIGALPLDIQGRFLRFLEERTITRIGALVPIQVQTRVVAATNRNIAADAQNGSFLPDLYDRLSVFEICVPPLRKRTSDVPLLMKHYMGKKDYERITEKALHYLESYSFPGNIRELKNLCRRISVFYPQGQIGQDVIEELLTNRK